MPNSFLNTSWIVVEVRSGIPISAKVFSEYGLAEEYSENLRKNMNLENDETGILPIDFEGIKKLNRIIKSRLSNLKEKD